MFLELFHFKYNVERENFFYFDFFMFIHRLVRKKEEKFFRECLKARMHKGMYAYTKNKKKNEKKFSVYDVEYFIYYTLCIIHMYYMYVYIRS